MVSCHIYYCNSKHWRQHKFSCCVFLERLFSSWRFKYKNYREINFGTFAESYVPISEGPLSEALLHWHVMVYPFWWIIVHWLKPFFTSIYFQTCINHYVNINNHNMCYVVLLPLKKTSLAWSKRLVKKKKFLVNFPASAKHSMWIVSTVPSHTGLYSKYLGYWYHWYI